MACEEGFAPGRKPYCSAVDGRYSEMERYVYRLIGRDLELLGESLDLAGIEAAGKEGRQRVGACAKWNVSGQ